MLSEFRQEGVAEPWQHHPGGEYSQGHRGWETSAYQYSAVNINRPSWVQVPYTDHHIYKYTQQDSFYEYPERLGLDLERMVEVDDLSHLDPPSIEAFLQSWLYFGLLQDLFKLIEVDVNCDDLYIIPNLKKMLITTEKLAKYVTQWKRNEREKSGTLDPAGKESRSSKMIDILDLARRIIRPTTEQYLIRVQEEGFQLTPVSFLSPLLSLTIQTLGLSLASPFAISTTSCWWKQICTGVIIFC